MRAQRISRLLLSLVILLPAVGGQAAGDTPLVWEVMLRRAAALRLDGQCDRAIDLARTVRKRAAEKDDKPTELAACLELGQDLMRSALGESFAVTPFEADLDGAEEAYTRAVELAEALDDKPSLAAAERELGVLGNSRVRAWFVERFKAGEHIGILRHVAAGGRLDDVMPTLPIYPVGHQAMGHLMKALELPPSLIRLPGGCPFHPRCPEVLSRCRTEVPPLRKLAAGHASACWLPERHGGTA